MYSKDLAHVHDTGFSAFARRIAPEIVRLLTDAGIAGGLIVEIGCGSGVLARHLSDAGYRVLGYDLSPSMIRLARARARGATFRVASLTDARIPRCAAIVSVGEVVTYVDGGIAALRRFFRRAHEALEPGGLLVFDFIESARGRTYATKTCKGDDWTMAVRADFARDTRILTRRIAIVRQSGRQPSRSYEVHRVHVYRRGDVVEALEQCGFAVTVGRSLGRRRLIIGDAAVVARKTRV